MIILPNIVNLLFMITLLFLNILDPFAFILVPFSRIPDQSSPSPSQ